MRSVVPLGPQVVPLQGHLCYAYCSCFSEIHQSSGLPVPSSSSSSLPLPSRGSCSGVSLQLLRDPSFAVLWCQSVTCLTFYAVSWNILYIFPLPPSSSVAGPEPLEENPNTGLKGFPGVSCIPSLALPATLHTFLQAYWPSYSSSDPPWMFCTHGPRHTGFLVVPLPLRGCCASEKRMRFPPPFPHHHLQAAFLHSTYSPSSGHFLPRRPP